MCAAQETRAHRFPRPFLLMMESLSREQWQLSSAAGSAGAVSSSISRPGVVSIHLREASSGPPKVTELPLPAYTPPEQQKGIAISRLWEIPGEVKIQSRFKLVPVSILGVIGMKFTFVKGGTRPPSAPSLFAFVNISILFSH